MRLKNYASPNIKETTFSNKLRKYLKIIIKNSMFSKENSRDLFLNIFAHKNICIVFNKKNCHFFQKSK